MNLKNKLLYLIKLILKKIIIKKNNFSNRKDQFVVFSNDLISSEIILNQYYEKNNLFFLQNEIFKKYINKNTDICLDIGANIGNHSNFFSQNFYKVVSFEPNLKSFSLLKLNTQNKKNIDIYNYALSDKKQIINFFENKDNYGASKIIKKKFSPENLDVTQIETQILDNKIKELKLKNIKYIKIDTEDHDINIIKGCKNYLKNNNPFISIELKKYDYKSEINNFELILVLRDLGYKYFYNVLKYKNQNKFKNFLFKLINFFIFYKNDQSYYFEKINKFNKIDYEFVMVSKKDI